MAFAILLALAVAVFALYTIVDRVLTPTETTTNPFIGVTGTVATLVTPTTTGSSTGTTAGGKLGGSLLVRPAAATASSSLKSTNISDFRPTNLLDGDLGSGWIEGAAGVGIGEWVRLDFDSAIVLDRIEIANGYQKDAERFEGNERIENIQVEYSDGTSQVVRLLDTEGLQAVRPAVEDTEWIKLTILSIYPSYVWEDAALSDVRVYEAVR